MDILTPKGRISRQQELEAIAIWNRHYPHIQYEETDKELPIVYDALMMKDGVCVGIAETRCRGISYSDFFNVFNGTWLVTMEKLTNCIAIARQHNVPLVGFLYLAPSKVLLFDTIWRPTSDGIVLPHYVRTTETQATVNGGRAVRENAFLNMKNAKCLR